MILNAEQIAGRLQDKQEDPLVITPEPDIAELKQSGSASVDLRLGSWFVSLRQARMSCLKVEDSANSPAYSQFTKTSFVAFGKAYYLHPRAFVLGATLEWVRLPKDLAGYVIGRSSWGRRGLIIATAIGVHPGFTGCLTLELTNVGEIPIEMRPGMSICQLMLHRVDKSSDYTDASPFIGLRRPVVGKVQSDPIAELLSKCE